MLLSRCRNKEMGSYVDSVNQRKGLFSKIHSYIHSGDRFVSFEFFPPKTKRVAAKSIARLKKSCFEVPLFIDVTWHPPSMPRKASVTSSLNVAGVLLKLYPTVLHLSCCQMTKTEATTILTTAKKMGISNILALRGDLPPNWKAKADGFSHAVDLVTHIRKHFHQDFTIFVAAHPNGHPEAESYVADLYHLKKKVDAGADFIITQMFFQTEDLVKFVADCRRIGIKVPIIAGIMQIMSWANLNRVMNMAAINMPEPIEKVMKSIKNNREAVHRFGIHLAVKQCQDLLNKDIAGFNFFTFNRTDVTKSILQQLGIIVREVKLDILWHSDSLKVDNVRLTTIGHTLNGKLWIFNKDAYLNDDLHCTLYNWGMTDIYIYNGRWFQLFARKSILNFFLKRQHTRLASYHRYLKENVLVHIEDCWYLLELESLLQIVGK